MNYTLDGEGVYRPVTPIQHREEEYSETGFKTLLAMHQRHFWYRGRHRFILGALDYFHPEAKAPWSAIDLGGGVGGWIRYIADHTLDRFRTLALADSSMIALQMAATILPKDVQRYQVDLMNLGWQERWDIAFLLDVIEHLPNDIGAMHQAAQALTPGGLILATAPAFQRFWSYNDDVSSHLRRYTCSDFIRLAHQTGLRLLDARYFMFLLSPLYLLSRIRPSIKNMDEEQRKILVTNQHRIPVAPVNESLNAIFALEAPLGHWFRFPWGTSILGVFQKP